jgi:hypothetical protein
MAIADDLINLALKMLAQTTASGQVIAGLFGGASEAGAPVIDGNTQMLFWLSEAQNRLARLCLPIPDYAAIQAAAPGAQTIGPYTNLVAPSGRTMHQAAGVWIGSKQLAPANMGFLSSGNWYPADIMGDPTAWANNNTGIALSSYTTQPWFTISGYFLPVPLTSLSQELDPNIDDYSEIAMWAYLAWRIAVSNQDNSVLFERAGVCLQEFAGTVREIYTRLISNDSTISSFYPAQAIDAQVQVMKQFVPKT